MSIKIELKLIFILFQPDWKYQGVISSLHIKCSGESTIHFNNNVVFFCPLCSRIVSWWKVMILNFIGYV